MSQRMILAATLGGLLLLGATGAARSGMQVLDVGVGPLFSKPENVARLPEGVRFTFGDAPVEVVQSLGPVRSNRASVKGNRTLSDACRWAMLGALKGLGEQARAKGSNAVIRLTSTIDDQPGSDTTFRCRVSNSIVHVAVTGELAQVK
ncbi:hypothetical protein [Caulobacter sp. NIBR1757]|uniref:hypothetical protein n=1 Tax=Caulobacter sp. NIBR1757 TaxID=3016000 RepID=UPI0022F14242|nr:hypothetical protein [Caulobacter sp. NIBR1757]WGM40537.1 hypothetical protein AMEJIAPC_03482 [Caulobacter sp. NIBR1757]